MKRHEFANGDAYFKRLRSKFIMAGEVWVSKAYSSNHDAIYILAVPNANSCSPDEQLFEVEFLESTKNMEQKAAAKVSANRWSGFATDTGSPAMEMDEMRSATDMKMLYDYRARMSPAMPS